MDEVASGCEFFTEVGGVKVWEFVCEDCLKRPSSNDEMADIVEYHEMADIVEYHEVEGSDPF
jgi:hypothetical protein